VDWAAQLSDAQSGSPVLKCLLHLPWPAHEHGCCLHLMIQSEYQHRLFSGFVRLGLVLPMQLLYEVCTGRAHLNGPRSPPRFALLQWLSTDASSANLFGRVAGSPATSCSRKATIIANASSGERVTCGSFQDLGLRTLACLTSRCEACIPETRDPQSWPCCSLQATRAVN
jgi:hypothetical protein